MNPIVSRVIGAAVGIGAAKLASKGITLDAASQSAITVFIYAGLHKVLEGIKITVKRK